MIPNSLLQNQRLVGLNTVHSGLLNPAKLLFAPILGLLTIMQLHCFMIGC